MSRAVTPTPWRRNPPELFLLALCLLSGALFLAGARPPDPVQQAMPGWVVWAWYLMLTVAGAVGTAGNLWPGQLVTAYRIRLSGQLLTAGPAAAYALAVAAYAWGSPLAWAVVAVWSGCSLWTARLLAADLRRIRRLP